jgi:diacylglycerol kinase (ATP)
MHNPGALFLFVINPVSGGREKHDWEAAIRDHFKESSHRAEFYLLTGGDDRRSIQHYIERIKPDKVIAVGGDGTVKMLAQMLRETPTPLGIIPAGSANGMAMELGIPTDIDQALDVVVNGEVRKVDLIRINEVETCVHLSDLGLNAMLVKYFEQSKKRGMWGYGKALFRVLWQKQKMKLSIVADGTELKRSAYMVVIANARKYGTGANINPEGDIADGKFEIVIVRKLNLLEIVKAIFTDRMFHPKRIEVIAVSNVEITVHRKTYFQVDGEFKGKTNHISARISPAVLNIIQPRPSD